MRNAIPFLALSAVLAAQEPPVLTNTPPAQDAAFGPAGLGGGITEVAQITFLCKWGSSPASWYGTATVKTPASAFYTGATFNVTATAPGAYTVTNLSAAELINLPAPTTDYFAFNASFDRLVMVFDTGGTSAPAVYVRPNNNKGTPWIPYGSIGAPVPIGYRDSQIGDGLMPGNNVSWDGVSAGAFEFVYIDGNDLKKIRVNLAGAPGSGVVTTVGSPTTIAMSTVVKHSPSAMRQGFSGLPSDCGISRALIYSQNDSSADAYFRSSMGSVNNQAPGLRVYDDASWKANPGHIGGSMYWAYAPTGYVNPLKINTVCMSSSDVPASGGTVTLVCWAPPGTDIQAGFVMLGALQSPGIPLPGITIGNLGLNIAALTFLPTQVFDQTWGEMGYTFITGLLPRVRIDMQVGCVNLTRNQIYLGNNAQVLPF